MPDRYSRHLGLFGEEGQQRIVDSTAAIVGYGGLGAHVGQQLAYLGIRRFRIIEHDKVDTTSLNRLVGASPQDVDEPKVVVAARTIRQIQPDADVRCLAERFDESTGAAFLADATVLFGCVDDDISRLTILQFASEHGIDYIDSATDTGQDNGTLWYGGRVATALGDGCPMCMDVLDPQALALGRMTAEQQDAHARIYGVSSSELDGSGPSVVS